MEDTQNILLTNLLHSNDDSGLPNSTFISLSSDTEPFIQPSTDINTSFHSSSDIDSILYSRKDVMIDIETLSTCQNSVIISIAAITFNLFDGSYNNPFYVNVDINSCIDLGLEIDGNTLYWWLNQSDESINKWLPPKTHSNKSLSQCLHDLESYIQFDDYNNVYLWSKGPRFDLGILSNAYHKLKRKIPWKYTNERCVRTIIELNNLQSSFHFESSTYSQLNSPQLSNIHFDTNQVDNSQIQQLELSNLHNDTFLLKKGEETSLPVKEKNDICQKIQVKEVIHDPIFDCINQIQDTCKLYQKMFK